MKVTEIKLPKDLKEKLTHLQNSEKDLWCSCIKSDPMKWRYWPDNTHPHCKKHCYTCSTCGKITQVG